MYNEIRKYSKSKYVNKNLSKKCIRIPPVYIYTLICTFISIKMYLKLFFYEKNFKKFANSDT